MGLIVYKIAYKIRGLNRDMRRYVENSHDYII